ncbi:ABC-type branched-subunit amino acid transport system substrate-binding protein [Ilumatobacter fluminis]|uniref:ABC-type branched-subunit amino acid transport system substrate-binding protein n=1 Tax=Ilumatobacter fluminis TaxID=467091 RepID=A0A4R7I0W7_9ACTN|nr:peptidoglycan-binding protein [Ilumatobacter fluminis]TDT17182.1 ABC-type branched-subunit amino acid transport system substrate-binding protein [Ilumatobacter fluminis]
MRSTIRRSRFGRAAAAVTAVALLASACSGDDDDDEPSDDSAVDEPSDDDGDDGDDAADDGDDDAPALDGDGLTIGFIQPEVGLFDLLGAAQEGGLALAADDIAAGGGVLGGELTIVAERPTPERDVTAVFESMVADTSPLIVGPATSADARAIIPLLGSNDAVVCGASVTAPGLTTLEGADGRFLRTTFDDNIVAIHTFDRVREYTADVIGRQPKVTIVSRGDEYGDGLSNTLAGMLGLVGIEVTVERYNPADVLMTGLGEQVAATAADLYVMIALEEGPRLAGVMQEAGVAPDTMLGLDGLATPRLGEKAVPQDPAALDGATVIGATGPVSFLTRLLDQQAAQGEVLYGAQAYDCAISMALAVEAAGSTDPAEVSAAMRTVTGGDGTVCTTYADCRALLADGLDIDYQGPSGPIDFAEDGEPGGGRFITARDSSGTLHIVADLTISLEEIRDRVAPQLAGFIADMQTALTELGYYAGPIDGQMNDEFAAAIAAFQTDNGLEPTGELDAATIAAIQQALGENPILTATITEVQQLLTELGYYTGPIDGLWSEALSDAIKAFQTDLGVEPTGILDAATLQAIYQAGANSGGDQPPASTTTTTIGTGTTIPVDTTTTTAAPTTTAPPATTTTSAAPTTTTTVPVPADSILGVLIANPQFSELVALLDTPGLEAVKGQLSDPSAAATLMAPNNDALPDDAATAPTDDLIDLLSFHVVTTVLDPLADGDYATALSGQDLTVAGTTVSNADASVTANILGDALPTAAGVVWEIDTLLAPPQP